MRLEQLSPAGLPAPKGLHAPPWTACMCPCSPQELCIPLLGCAVPLQDKGYICVCVVQGLETPNPEAGCQERLNAKICT